MVIGNRKAATMTERKTHIVAIPLPVHGHITALLQLCRILTASDPGISVTFLTTDPQQSHAHAQNTPSSLRIRFASVDFCMEPPPPGWGSYRYFLAQFDELEEPIRRFVSTSLERKPDLILSDVYIGWAQDMSNQLGIPRIALWTSSASECLVYHYAPSLIHRSILPFKVPKGRSEERPDNLIDGFEMENPPVFHRVPTGGEGDVVVDIPGLSPLHRGEFPCFLQIEDGDDILFHGFIKQASRMAEADMVLLNTFYGLEATIIQELKKEMCVVPIGPLFLMDELHEYNNKEMAMKNNEGKKCLEWLDQQAKDSVVYVSFGSFIPLLGSQVEEIASGLEGCGKPFLWSLKSNIPLPEGFLERCKDRGMVVDWVPQTLILSHPSTAVFLSHCGWNSSLESLALGVPLICCPRGGDQILNAKMIVDEWGLGLRLATVGNFLTAKGLASAIKQLLPHDDNGDDVSSESKTRGIVVRAKVRALQQVVCNSIDSTFNAGGDALHCPTSREALHILMQFIASHSQSE